MEGVHTCGGKLNGQEQDRVILVGIIRTDWEKNLPNTGDIRYPTQGKKHFCYLATISTSTESVFFPFTEKFKIH